MLPLADAILTALLVAAGAFLAGSGVYLVSLAVASSGRPQARPSLAADPVKRLVVLVPAHNEEALVARCVTSLLAQTYPRTLFQLVVIADNCTDRTAAEASAAGAAVLVRDQPDERGKGRALRWAMDRVLASPDRQDGIVVVDADSVADENLLTALAIEFQSGHDVVQADYRLLEGATSTGSDLSGAGFLLFHRVRFTGRARLGMAANLVGNGMLFSSVVLGAHPWDAFTGVEDLEYSIRLRLAGIRPHFAPDALVAGPGAASSAGAVRQRQRWEGGRFFVARRYLPQLIRASMAHPGMGLLDVAIDLATPPLALLALALLGGTLLAVLPVAAGMSPVWALTPWLVGLAAVPAFVVIGLRSAGTPGSIRRILMRSPAFLTWKLMTYVRIFRGHDVHRWDRTDRVAS